MLLLEVAGGGGGVLRDVPAVSVCGSGVDGGAAVGGVLHPGPAQGHGVHVGREGDLAVRGDGVEAVEPVQPGGVALVDLHQHGGGLGPGGGEVGLEEERPVLLDAADHADLPGQGDVALVLGHVGEGVLIPGVVLGQVLIAQGPHQHDGHLLPADLVVGAEGAAAVHDAVGPGGLHIAVGPVGGGAVDVGGGLGLLHRPAEHLAQHGDEGRPVEVLIGVERAGLIAHHQAVALGLVDDGLGPVSFRVAEGGGGQGKREGGAQRGSQCRGSQPPFQCFHQKTS